MKQKKQMQNYIWPGTDFTSHLCKKNSNNWLKNTLENILELNSPQERKSFNDNFCRKKHFHQNSNKILGTEERQTS